MAAQRISEFRNQPLRRRILHAGVDPRSADVAFESQSQLQPARPSVFSMSADAIPETAKFGVHGKSLHANGRLRHIPSDLHIPRRLVRRDRCDSADVAVEIADP